LLALKGYTQEVEDAYTRALELCEGRGEIPQLLPVLRGLASFYLYRAEFEKGARIGEQVISLGERNSDERMQVEGHLLLGANLAFLNDLRAGLDHIERGIAAYDPQRHKPGRFQLGNNPGVVCLTMSALVFWMLGFPDRSRSRANEAIALAKKLNHPSSAAYAEFHAGLIDLWIGDDGLAHSHAQAVLEVANQQDFEIWQVVGSCLRGAAMARLGLAGEGLAIIEQSMNTYQRLNTPPVFWPMLLYLQAGACLRAARPADGLRLIDEAIEIGSQSSGKTLSSEFFQVKGDLLLAQSPKNVSEAESWYQNALDAAVEVDALMMQLRSALRLARLWRDRGETEKARNLLSETYNNFTEGYETADLREANALLSANPSTSH
jgi:tetratricopeptide (TPR) repeat protein